MGEPLPLEDAPVAGAAAVVKTLAVTDLVDSTGLFAALGDRRAAELCARHERLARDLLVRFEGREIDKTDGFLTLFDRAVDAVRFALAYHRALDDLSRQEGVELQARVGVHLGEVILRANPPEDVARGAKPMEIEGYAKPIAARVMALAKGRQTLLTRGAFDLARQAATREPGSGPELRWLAHGPYLLKGVTEPVEVFEVGEAGFAPLLVPRSTAKARRAVSAEDEVTLGWRPAPGLEVPRRRHWRLVGKLGEGGFGEVWRGTHDKTGESRVFKFCYQADRLRSLQREVTLFRLMKETLGNRRDIARILDWNFDEAPYFLECEYTEGGNLLEWVAERGGPEALPLEVKLELVAQVAEALAAAHSVGVLHKDVKPSNVLVTTGPDGRPEVRLTDFGIGLVTDREVLASRGITVFDLTELLPEGSGSEGGTHLYMAPELVEGRAATVQADVYALGVMLYQLVAGDFSRALAPGWRRDVPDEILQEDLAALVDGRPERRMRDAHEVAVRLRTLEERRRRREAERREAEEREAERRALERAHRRRKAALAIAAASVAVLAVVTVLALQAMDARREAERRRGQAEGLIGFMVGDLRGKLEPIGRLEILDDVGSQALEYFEAVPEEDLTDEEVFQRSETLRQIGQIRVARGDLPAAMEAYRESLVLATTLTARDPQNLEWQKGLGASHFWVGFVHWRQNDLDPAEAEFRKYLAIAEHLAAEEPENPEWRLETAYSLSNLGSIHQYRGELQEALRSFRESLAIRESLVRENPSNREWRRGLGVAHNKLGVILADMGRAEEALTHFRQDLEVTADLLDLSPDDTDLSHRKATAQSFVGEALAELGRTDDALSFYRQARETFEGLTSRDPTNRIWQHALGVLHWQTGSALLTSARVSDALVEFSVARTLLEVLVQDAATDSLWHHDVARVEIATGEALLGLGRHAEARTQIERTLDSLQALSGRVGATRQFDALRARAHVLLGNIASSSSEPEAATRSWRRAYELLEPRLEGASDRDLYLLACE
ncbi:MAG TPA: protein kinase, partial [Thermoanaerobaculia bacterium]